jgi:flagellar biosynthetic protein FliO
MKFSKLTRKRFLHVLFVFPLALVVFTGPLAGLGTGLVKTSSRVERASTKPLPQEEPLTSMPVVEEAPLNEEPGLFGPGARAVGAMIVVLSLIWITMVLLKRYMPHRFGPLGHKRRIQVLETVPIGDKRSLTLVRIDDEDLLLASTPASVSLIKQVRLASTETTTYRSAPGSLVTPEPSTQPTPLETTQKFSETLADEIRLSNLSIEGSLAGFARLRQELEAR